MVLYKFKPVTELAHLLDIIVNERLYCHHYEGLNDPFEGQFERMVGRGDVQRDFGTAGEVDREVPTRICSLSRCCDDVRMWSLYAGSFAGAAVEVTLDPARLPLYPVRYARRLPAIDVSRGPEAAVRALTTKTSHWRYEKEWRLLSQQAQIEVPGAVRRVILGMRMPSEVADIIGRVVRPHTEVCQARLDPAGACIVVGPPRPATGRAAALQTVPPRDC